LGFALANCYSWRGHAIAQGNAVIYEVWMGIDVPSAQFLCCAKNMGVDFADTMMVGRQTVNARPDAIASILSAIGVPREQTSVISEGQFAEPLFTLLGARQVSSVDVSDYEKATYVHDFNRPIPASLANRFSVVHDGGTIEHVFNIPQAFMNCMEMVRIGGHFVQVNVANNYMGHGFWQFCPELIYRIFSPENGFLVRAVLMHEPDEYSRQGHSSGRWYKVDDPAAHHNRVELVNGRPTYICTIAQRVVDRTIFEHFPQQSDYVDAWRPRQPSPEFSQQRRGVTRRIIPRSIKKLIRAGRLFDSVAMPGPFDRPYYRRISDNDVLSGRV
jgi:hypothetical protein